MSLTFEVLRNACIARPPTFKNAKGEPAHSKPDGSVFRGDMSLDEARPALAKELADIQIYLDLLALQCGIDLGQATMEKFNEVSRRVGSPILIINGHGLGNAFVIDERNG